MLLSLAQRTQAQDVWTSPNPGLRHLHRTTVAPAAFHALIVDLRHPGVGSVVTPSAERWKTTSGFARDAALAGAINAGPWSLFSQQAKGLVVSQGTAWSPDDEQLGFFGVDVRGVARIVAPREARPAEREIAEGVAGYSILVNEGRVTRPIVQLNSGRDARSAVGVSRDGKTVILATADGRQATSAGATLEELALLMIELGAERALNLDGGNSTSMFVAGDGGLVSRPARGWEREAVTHLGVRAPAAPAANPQILRTDGIQAPAERIRGAALPMRMRIVDTPEAVQAYSARPIPQADRGTRGRLSSIWLLDRLFIGQAREWVIPGLTICLPLLLTGLAALWLRRSRDQARAATR
jgi:hypothetical protein